LTKLAEHLRFGDLEAPQRLLEPGSLAGGDNIFVDFFLGGNTSRFLFPIFFFKLLVFFSHFFWFDVLIF
jgi:hypothetical protein